MSNNISPSQEFPKPESPKGSIENTILLMMGKKGCDIFVEPIGDGVFELTISVFDKPRNHKKCRHIEYVLHCRKKSLEELQDRIDIVLT